MECCYVLTVWVDILVSFYSARRSLGARDSNRLMKTCALCINRVSGVLQFGLWCCGLSNESFMVLGQDGTIHMEMLK